MTWKTASRKTNWICSAIAPPVNTGGRISSDCYSPRWPTPWIEAIRRIALKGTELANAYVGTIRLKLFKIGAVILKNTRRIRFLLASGCPYKETLLPGRESTRTRINPKRLKHSRVENTHGYLCLKNDFSAKITAVTSLPLGNE